MKTISLAALLLSGGCVLAANPALAGSYLSMKTGDNALFNADGRFAGDDRVVTIAQVRGSQRLYSDFAGLGQAWLSSPSTSEIIEIQLFDGSQGKDGPKRVLADFSKPVGTTFTVNLNECTETAQLSSKTETLTTDAGSFKNVAILTFSGPCNDAGLRHIAFAPGVGVIEYSEDNFAGANSYRLAVAHIGAQHFPKLGLSVSADVTTARTLVSNGVSYASAIFTVKNSSDAALPVTFFGKDYDVALLDSNGVEVNRYSKGRSYSTAITNTTLATGSQYRYFARMPLVDLAGNPLEIGSYQMRLEFHGYIKPFDGAPAVRGQRPAAVSVPVFIDRRMTHMSGAAQ